MDPRLLGYYNRELQYVRGLGAEFAREFPRIAGRLGLDTFECSDPYVERLLEGFAFMSARVHLKIDSEFPRFTQHLLEIAYPHYLSPTPSMAVVELRPNLSEGALAEGFPVRRGSTLRSLLGRGEQTACEYRTAHDVTLWPLEIDRVEYSGFVGDLGDLRLPARVRSTLRLKLKVTAGLTCRELALDDLTLFLRGADDLPGRLFENLIGHSIAVVARPTQRPAPWQHVVVDGAVEARGFEDDEALLPYGPRSFQGYRLLHEYFAFPQRYLFARLRDLAPAMKRCTDSEIEIVVLLDNHVPSLEGVLTTDNVALHCTPAINLFPRRADRIHLTDATNEYHVVPDRARPMDFEVHTIREVVGTGATAGSKVLFRPFFAWNHETTKDDGDTYYTISRQARMLSSKQRASGTRSSYVGSEVFLSIVDQDEGPYRSDLRQLAVEALCTNRDLPLHMAVGQSRTDFTLDAGAPVESIRCQAGPTPPRASHAHGDTSWRLISHLSLNYLSLIDGDGAPGASAAALREMLSLYADLADPTLRRQIEGVREIGATGTTRSLPVPGPTVYGRGLEVTVTCDESAYEGASAFLLGAVLERFFAKYVSLNSFTETVLRTVQRGEVMRWPSRTGLRPTL
jgi:type VI secretion system protein ImpG